MKTPKTVLICTLGRTPQVFVETVWSLANGKNPIVPDEIIAVSMANYAEFVKDSIFGKDGGWEKLIANLRKAKIAVAEKIEKLNFKEITVATDGKGLIEDLQTTEDNIRCADYLFGLIQKYALDNSTRIILSLSGGRKSLSALATITMSLLARSQDSLIHLIVDSGIENDGKYHFPRGGKGFSLFEIPFVRTRGLLKGVAIDRVRRFKECLRLTQGMVPDMDEFPKLTLDMSSATLRLGDNKPISGIDSARLVLLWLIFREKVLDRDRFRVMLDAAKNVETQGCTPVWFSNLKWKKTLPEFRQIIDLTKKKVLGERLGLPEEFCRALLPNSDGKSSVFGIKYPKESLVVKESDFSDWLYQQIIPKS